MDYASVNKTLGLKISISNFQIIEEIVEVKLGVILIFLCATSWSKLDRG